MEGREKDDFGISGPKHLTSVDWSCPLHRMAVMASLVMGVYVLERDLDKPWWEDLFQYFKLKEKLKYFQLKEKLAKDGGSDNEHSLAEPWWDSFHFELKEKIVDEPGTVFGCIFQYKPEIDVVVNAVDDVGIVGVDNAPPAYVVAFRGTIKTTIQDLAMDVCIGLNQLHVTSRFQIAMQVVERTIAAAGSSRCWLAGHSLGATLATIVGTIMVEKADVLLETFLFNPPFVSVASSVEQMIYQANSHKLLRAKVVWNVCKILFAVAANGRQEFYKNHESFKRLSSWMPRCFVNPRDLICCEYIGYFQKREDMKKSIVLRIIERFATQHSYLDLFYKTFGVDSRPFHLLPSTTLTINTSDHGTSHGISQWWKPDLLLDCKDYKYS